MFEIVSIGSATLDLFLRSQGVEVQKEDGLKEICVPYGAKIPVEEAHLDSGGGGTNTAFTFARQGFKVACVVKLADDFFGQKIIKDLVNEGIETEFLVTERGGQTDFGTILWAPDGGRTILVYRGETKLEISEIAWEKLSSQWFYLSSLEGNLDLVEKILGLGTKVAWNPGGMEILQKEKVLNLLPKVEILNLNKEEMGELLSLSVTKSKDLFQRAAMIPCSLVVITDDIQGAYLHQKGESFWWHVGIYNRLPRLESTGAGDAFGSGFVSGQLKGFSVTESLKLATANAGSVVSHVGAKKGILKMIEIEDWLKKEILIERVNF